MRRRTICGGLWMTAMLLVSIVACESAHAAEGPTKKLLLLGIDGCRFDALRTAKAPHLDGLIERGVAADPIRIFPERYREADTISGPGWSSILTGVWADKHGVLDNEFTAPKYDQYPPFFMRLKQVRPEAVVGSFSDWDPVAGTIMASVAGARDFTEQRDGEKGESYELSDAAVTAAAVEFLSTQDPTATFVYLGQVDEAGHAHGFHPSVPEYVAAIERVDGHVGEIVDAVASRPTYADEDWLVLVTADHGGHGTSHSAGHDVPDIARSFLIVSGPAVDRDAQPGQCGLVDAATTGLAHLGVAIDPAWGLDGQVVGLSAGERKK